MKNKVASVILPAAAPPSAPPVFDHAEIGARIRDARRAAGLTLAALSQRSGIAVSTISKAERGEIALTYDKFAALARSLSLDFDRLLGRHRSVPRARPAPCFTPSGQQVIYDTPNYEYGMLAADLSGKRMVPMRAHVRARRLEDFPDYIRHGGEEFVFLLRGELQLCFEDAQRFRLRPGDSLYFDSSLGHVYLSCGEGDAEVLVCCAGANVDRPEDLI